MTPPGLASSQHNPSGRSPRDALARVSCCEEPVNPAAGNGGAGNGGEGNLVELLRPGSFVRLRDHPDDLPPFQLIACRGGRCWVRQQAWGILVHWEVAHRRLTQAA